MSRRIIITAGGTGGHIFPAIAVARALSKLDASIEFLFVGSNGGMEIGIVPKYNFQIRGVTVSGLMRSLTLKNIWRNLSFPFKLLKGLSQSRAILREFKPDVVVGFGGFASGPVGRSAVKMNIPLVLCEANAYPGLTNKLLAPSAAKVLLGDEAAKKFLTGTNIKVTGNPVRETLTEGNRNAGLQSLGLDPNKKVVLSLGGSLGAGTINQSLENGLNAFIENDVQLVWQCGKRYYDELNSRIASHPSIRLMPFIDNMADAFAAADLVISRAGASTIAELLLLNKPSILVPSPNVAEDHQTRNAMSLVNRNACVLVKDAEAKDKLAATAVTLVKDDSQMAALTAALNAMEKHDAAQLIATEILEVMKR
jgi:UDP-N-acetylglucosamine--N-acetylmuramyl-(pentapeptide) pyrophosphoryl-undecaprenol N-acetylglucosamine transferase